MKTHVPQNFNGVISYLGFLRVTLHADQKAGQWRNSSQQQVKGKDLVLEWENNGLDSYLHFFPAAQSWTLLTFVVFPSFISQISTRLSCTLLSTKQEADEIQLITHLVFTSLKKRVCMPGHSPHCQAPCVHVMSWLHTDWCCISQKLHELVWEVRAEQSSIWYQHFGWWLCRTYPKA